MRWPEFSTRRLLLCVGFSAALLGIVVTIAREDASPLSGLAIVLGCFALLTAVRFAGQVAATNASPGPPTPTRIAGFLVGSLFVSAAILITADLAFLTVHQTAISWFHTRRSHSREPAMDVRGVVLGLFAAVWVSRRLIDYFSPHREGATPRRLVRLWPIGLVAALGIEPMMDWCSKFSWRQMMSDYHMEQASLAQDGEARAYHLKWFRAYAKQAGRW
jgi:hypothetical protein